MTQPDPSTNPERAPSDPPRKESVDDPSYGAPSSTAPPKTETASKAPSTLAPSTLAPSTPAPSDPVPSEPAQADISQAEIEQAEMSQESIAQPNFARQAVDEIDLETILDAWQTATDRLQQTHELLRTEVARLSDELEEKNRELARQNRLADIGRMAAHVAHEVRNNLMPMTLYVSLLQRRVAEDREACGVIDKIKSGLTELETTVSDLLHFTSDRDPQLSRFPVARLTREVIESLTLQLQSQSIETQINVEPSLELEADYGMVRRAMINLVMNAIDAMPQGGMLEVETNLSDAELVLAVKDRGMGLAEETLSRLMEPFFTTKSEGTGLGLAIVERIASTHGGRLIPSNRAEGGAEFQMRFPRSRKEQAA